MTPDFASHWSLAPAVAYLNHGSFGACPLAVQELQTELRRELEREPVDFLARRLQGRLDGAREELAAFLGAEAADLAFVPNATTGVNAVLRSLQFQPGDELLAPPATSTPPATGPWSTWPHGVAPAWWWRSCPSPWPARTTWSRPSWPR